MTRGCGAQVSSQHSAARGARVGQSIVRALSQTVIICGLALLLGVDLNWNPLALARVLVTVVLGAALFSSFSLIIDSIVKTRERFMCIGQFFTMPLFLASNAICPVVVTAACLHGISDFNPLTYEVDSLQSLMVARTPSSFGLGWDLLVLIVVIIGAKFYPRIAV